MNPEIADFICAVLNDEEHDEAMKLGILYLQERNLPVQRYLELDNKIGVLLPVHTKYPIRYRSIIRPIKFYCYVDIAKGIRLPRNFVLNVSAHLEGCAKLLLETIEGARCENVPLESVLHKLAKLSAPMDLIEKCRAFNKLIFVRAKYDLDIPEDERLFDIADAVMVYFTARKLAKQLLDVKDIKIPLNEVSDDPVRVR
jgi:hypothetical protein